MKKIRYRREIGELISELGISGDAAEIGVAEGLFAEEILTWPVKFPRVYLVDRWARNPAQKGDASNPTVWHEKNFRRVQEVVRRYSPRAVVLRGESVDMARFVPDLSLAFLNIDGDHSFRGVLDDIHAWLPKVGPGGIIAFHDYLNPAYGVRDAVDLLAKALKREVHLLPENRDDDAGAYFILD